MSRRLLAAATAAVVAGLVFVPAASAHGLVGKQDLPIPKWLFGWAASVVLVVSFVGLTTLWKEARLEREPERPLLRLPAFVDPVCGAIGIALFAGLVYTGFAGSQVPTANAVPTVVYVLFWVGIPFASLFFGDVFRAFNPWRAFGRAIGWSAQRLAPQGLPEPLPYPERLGHYPAAVGILAFAIIELAIAGKDDPSKLMMLALAYVAVQLIGMAMYGVETWTSRGDAFAVYFRLFASLSPLRWTRTGLSVRVPLSGTSRLEVLPGTVVLLAVMIGSTSFDGFSVGSDWRSIGAWINDRFADAGLSIGDALVASRITGVVAAVLLVYGLYLLGCLGIRTLTRGRMPLAEVAARFVPSLVPIALAYVMAHYFGLLSYQGQATAYLISDPLGDGGDLFGTANATIDYGWISASGIWYVQVAVLVIGHACGLALAHDRALTMFRSTREAARSQYWMLAVMVAFTCLALWLLSGSD